MKSLVKRVGLSFVLVLALFAVLLSGQPSTQAQDVIKPESVIYSEENGLKIRLDVYQPAASDTPRPAVVMIHGGAGSFGEKSDMAEASLELAKAGYVAFNINYRLVSGDKNLWPTQLDDAQLAVRWVRANAEQYNVDPERICAMGHSFGGQLAALLGVRDTDPASGITLAEYSSKVKCVVDLAGSVAPADYPLTGDGAGLDVALYGGKVDEVRDMYEDASPVSQVDSESAAFLIFHGADDDLVPVEESRALTDALHEAGVEAVYAEYPHAGHFDWVFGSNTWDLYGPLTLAFLERHLKAES